MAEENKLIYGDRQFIAEALNCSQKSVEYIATGSRGKRNTAFQRMIKEAISFRERQNEELERFCLSKRMEITKVKVSE